MSENRRQFKNLLINPERQVHYGSVFLAVAIGVHSVATILMYFLYNAWTSQAFETSTFSMYLMIGGLVFIYLMVFGFAFMLGLVISHRIYGPLVNFDRHIANIKKGDYSSRIVLRKNDDIKLKQMADSLNDLADRLGKNQLTRP